MTTTFEMYWGIDVSKGWLDIAIDNQVFHITQTEKAIDTFIEKHQQNAQQTLVVLEHTGGYERLIVRRLSAAGFHIHVAHPNKVSAFAKARGRLAKTDRIDAKILLDYGRFIRMEELRPLLSQTQEELQLRGARLEQLKAMHHQEQCRLGSTCSAVVKKSHELMLKVLEKEIQMLESTLLKHIEADEPLTEKYQRLRSMKGVGPALAMVLLIDLPELGLINKKEVAALVGVAPVTHQSGQRQGKAQTRYGRPGIRKILYMAALTASRYNPRLKTFYERLIAAGKIKKVAIVAVMRKMLVILNAMIQTKSCFNA